MSPGKTKHYPLAQRLLFASAKGDLHEVTKLLQQGATIAINKHGRTALHIAANRGYLDIVRTLLQAGCNPDIQDDFGDTALHRAVSAANEVIVLRLLEESCHVDQRNNFGDTPLHEACRQGHTRTAKCLIKANANVHCRNKNDDVPLHMACANGHASAAQQLIYAGAKTSPSNKQMDTPLHLAVRFEHTTSVQLLLSSDCDVNAQNEFGNTALHLATTTRQKKLIRMLLNANADAKNVLNRDGKSPVDVAKSIGDGEMVLMLISGPRPQHHRQNSRSSSRKAPSKHRSQSVPKECPNSKSSSEECHPGSSLERKPAKIKVKKHRPTPSLSPKFHRQSSHRASLGKPSQRHNTLEDHQRNLVVNPYVVPQLYSLYRDTDGKVAQMPVISQLPNPTPQLVAQLHRTIQQAKQEWADSLKEATAEMNKRFERMENETDYRLKSLDQVTSERIKAERTMCLHRIDQRASYERQASENIIMKKLQSWMENRTEEMNNHNSERATSSGCEKPESFLRSTQPDIVCGHAMDSQSTQKSIPCSSGITESEVRSLDSGVGGTPVSKVLDPLVMTHKSHPNIHDLSLDKPLYRSSPFPEEHAPTMANVSHLVDSNADNDHYSFPYWSYNPGLNHANLWRSTPHSLHAVSTPVCQPCCLSTVRPRVEIGRSVATSYSCENLEYEPYHPSAEDDLYEKVLQHNLRKQHQSWLHQSENRYDVAQHLQQLSLATTHAV